MVTAGKIFKLRDRVDFDFIAGKLGSYRAEEAFEQGDYSFSLLTEISGCVVGPYGLRGLFSKDEVLFIPHHGEFVPTPKTVAAPFTFSVHNDRVLLTVIEKKMRANNIANQLSRTLFITAGHIVEAEILPDALRAYHEQNPEGTKIIFFDNVDIPNVNKLSLYGDSLSNTSLYNEYLDHGKIWYIVITSRADGTIVGITRDSVVTVFTRVDEDEFMSYVSREIFPMIV